MDAASDGCRERGVAAEIAIAIAVCLTALRLLLQNLSQALSRRVDGLSNDEVAGDRKRPLTVMAGIARRRSSRSRSVGAGALGAVFLVYLYPTRLTPSRLIATDIAHAIPLAIVAGLAT